MGITLHMAILCTAIDIDIHLSTGESDEGAVDIAVVFVFIARQSAASTIEAATYMATEEIHSGVTFDMSYLAAAIDVAGNVGLVLHVYARPPYGSVVVGSHLGHTTAGTVDAAAIALLKVVGLTNLAARDNDDGLSVVGVGIGVAGQHERSDGGQGTATIDIAVDNTALDADLGGVSDGARRGAVTFDIISSILADTRTSTIDVATSYPMDVVEVGDADEGSCRHGIAIRHTYLATIDNDGGFATHVTVLTATVDRAVEARTHSAVFGTNGDMGVVDITREECRSIGIARRERRADIGSRLTAAATEDVAQRQIILETVLGLLGVEDTHSTTGDGDIGVTRVGEGVTQSKTLGGPSLAVAGFTVVAGATTVVALTH